MPSPAVTYTFSNSTTADATQVNQNFTDIINALTDGTKDLSISALTVAGNATFTGTTITFGNATSDSVVFTALVGSHQSPSAHNTYDLGTVTTLGYRAMFFASSSATKTAKVIGPATASDITITLPASTGTLITSGQVPTIYGARYAVGINNSGTPNTQYDMDADEILLHDSSGFGVVRINPGAAKTNNISTAGSTANGRDQAGAFSSSSWCHLYWIWDGTTLATLSSATAPPTGPTLPTNYTHWAYFGAVYLNGSTNIVPTRIQGNTAYYVTRQQALNAGSAASTTAVSLTAFVPPNAHSVLLNYVIAVSGQTVGGQMVLDLEVSSGSQYAQLSANFTNLVVAQNGATIEIPNISQNVNYFVSNSGGNGTITATLNVLGYRIPNGC
jgi:hypothetical protein